VVRVLVAPGGHVSPLAKCFSKDNEDTLERTPMQIEESA